MAKSQQAARTDFHPTSAPAPILIGFDGTDGGRDALELGRVLNAIQGSPTIVATPHVTGLAEEARSALGDPAAETQEIGVLLPAMMLVESAKRHHAGTLVVGSTRRGRVGRVLLGSDIEQILHRTMGDVVVAPNGYASKRHPGFSRVVIAVPKPASEPVLARGEELARQAGAPARRSRSEGATTAAGGIASARPHPRSPRPANRIPTSSSSVGATGWITSASAR